MQFVSVDTHGNASPQFQHRHVQPEAELPPDREVGNDTANPITLSALPRTAGLAGDGWLETHSGAGSQVSISSHSPKPQSVHRFVVDLEESTGTSQISSQTSEVDCSYISPSKEAESVFITSGYMYVAPPASEFDSTSPTRESKDEETLIQKEENSPKGERGEADTKTEICETQFDSSGNPTTAILDTPSSAESTPVRHIGSLATEHVARENTHEAGLPNKSSSNLSKKEVAQEKEEGRMSSNSNGSSESDDVNQLPSIANRRLAFEQQAQRSKENGRNSTSKPTKQPPAVPKRVSSIPSLQKQENGALGGDQDATNPDKLSAAVVSPGPLQEENKVEAAAEAETELMPPPPPMSTHPGVVGKKPAMEEPLHSEQTKGEREDELLSNEKPKAEVVEHEEEDDEPVRELETPKPKVELRDSSKPRPVPKERRISVPAVKPTQEPEAEQNISSTEPAPVDVQNAPVIEPSTEKSSLSGDIPEAPSQDEIDGVTIEDNSDSKEKAEDNEVVASMSTFGHTASPTKSNLPTLAITSAGEEGSTSLDNIDPSKKIGAEVSTFKPTPKPRSTHRLSAVFDGSAAPTMSISKDSEAPPPPKLRTHNIPTPCSPPPTYTPEMKRSSAYYPTPVNREFLLRAQSMSILPTTGSASPRMVARGEQRQQMPPGFVVFSRSQEAVVGHGRNATLTSSSNMIRRTIQVDKMGGDGGQTGGSVPPPTAAPMNTKRGPTKKRRSLFRRK